MRIGFGRKLLQAVLATALFAVWPAPAVQKGRAAKAGRETAGAPQVAVEVFLERDREVIRGFFTRNQANLPPGLAKRQGALPPGLQKQLRRKGHMPPGLEKRLVPLPVELERQLPPLKPGLRRGVIEGHVVIVREGTRAILDVLVVF